MSSPLSSSRGTFPRARVTLSGAAALLVVFAAGCGGKTEAERLPVYPVEAAVTFKGQPMPGAVIAFHPKEPKAGAPAPRAEVGKDGVVKVSTYDGGDGAPEGEYVITIQWYKLVQKGPDLVAGPNVVPLKYAKPQTSDIVRRVAAGPNNLEPISL